MKIITARNVREALPLGVAHLLEHGQPGESRAGRVLVSPVPVMTVYAHPCERVLLSPVRDANPFFHLAESLWMLAGRNDTGFLDNFVKNFGERFAEPGGVPPVQHGAYGHRWRKALGFDQLDEVVRRLRDDPASRQAVIQMWDAGDFHHQDYDTVDWGSNDLRGSWRDRPCNTHVYLRVRSQGISAERWYGRPMPEYDDGEEMRRASTRESVLDLGINCRSNDIIMGAYGANAVHFSVLQEYLAARIGVGVGTMYQYSWNFHAYQRDLDALVQRAHASHEKRHPGIQDGGGYRLSTFLSDRREEVGSTLQLVHAPEVFDRELGYMLDAYDCLGEGPPDGAITEGVEELSNLFLGRVAWLMLMGHRAWRAGDRVRTDLYLEAVEAADWRVACQEWVERRRR